MKPLFSFCLLLLSLAPLAGAQTSFTLNTSYGSRNLSIDASGGIYFNDNNISVIRIYYTLYI